MSPNQHGKSSSPPNLATTNTGEGARDDAPLASVDDDVRIDRDVVDPKSGPGEQSLGSPQMEPASMELQPAETPTGPNVQKSPPARREPLIFNPLVLNTPVRIPPPAAAKKVKKQPQEPESEEETPTPRRTGCQRIAMSRRFSYPNTYQETTWLFDSVGSTRERLCLLDHATDTHCTRRRSETEEDAKLGVSVWKRTELERHYLRDHETKRQGPRMDGTDSGNLISEPEALEELPSLDMHLSSLQITEQDGPASTGHAPGDRIEIPQPSMDNQLGKSQSMVQSVDGAPQSIAYPAPVDLYNGWPMSPAEEQWEEPCSPYAPRDSGQGVRSKRPTGILEQAARIRRPSPYFNAAVTSKRLTHENATDGSTPETNGLATRSEASGTTQADGQLQFPSPAGTQSEGPSQQGHSNENPEKRGVTEKIHQNARGLSAQQWATGMKSYAAAVACLSTTTIGAVTGMHCSLTPMTQDDARDKDIWVALGNTWCFLGMALSTLLFWPLPSLHGRKPYTLGGLAMALVLQIPRSIAMASERPYDIEGRRDALLATWGVMGACLGIAGMNFYSTLLDVFGTSVATSHQTRAAEDDDTRCTGDGMGFWLGLYSWSWISSLSLGLGIGEAIANYRLPAWHLYASIGLLFFTLVLNVLVPDPRSIPYRRAVAEGRARPAGLTEPLIGEVMLRRVWKGLSSGTQEVCHGALVCGEMLRQPGFLVLTLYAGWVYALSALTMLSLASLSRSYSLVSDHGGYVVFVMAAGAFISIPFQRGSPLTRSRYRDGNSGAVTGEETVWVSDFARSVAIIVPLPLCVMGYAIASGGPPTSPSWPIALSGFIGFLSCLAVSECIALVLEAFDVPDLMPSARCQDFTKDQPPSGPD